MIKLICLHYLADFLLQSREMGRRKSEDINWLIAHLIIQFIIFLPFVGWRFSLVNALIHGLIDWNIWRLYKQSVYIRCNLTADDRKVYNQGGNKDEWKYWEDHLFYSTIGLDQSLHMMTLYCLWLIF